MPVTLARLAGIASLILAACELSNEADKVSRVHAIHTATILAVVILASAYLTHHVVDAALRRRTTTPAQFTDITETLAAAVKAEVAALFAAELEAAVSEVYRLGMVHGAERVARTHLVPVPREEPHGRR